MTIGQLLQIETEYEILYTEPKNGLTFFAHYNVSQFWGVVLMQSSYYAKGGEVLLV